MQCSVYCCCPGCRFCVGNGSCCKSGSFSQEGEARGNVLLALGEDRVECSCTCNCAPGQGVLREPSCCAAGGDCVMEDLSGRERLAKERTLSAFSERGRGSKGRMDDDVLSL